MVNFNEHFQYREKTNLDASQQRLRLKKLYRTNDFYNYGIVTALKRCEMDTKQFTYQVIATDYQENVIELVKFQKEHFQHIFRIYITTHPTPASENTYDEKYVLINDVSTHQLHMTLQHEGDELTVEACIEHEYSNALDYKKKLIALFNELHDLHTSRES